MTLVGCAAVWRLGIANVTRACTKATAVGCDHTSRQGPPDFNLPVGTDIFGRAARPVDNPRARMSLEHERKQPLLGMNTPRVGGPLISSLSASTDNFECWRWSYGSCAVSSDHLDTHVPWGVTRASRASSARRVRWISRWSGERRSAALRPIRSRPRPQPTPCPGPGRRAARGRRQGGRRRRVPGNTAALRGRAMLAGDDERRRADPALDPEPVRDALCQHRLPRADGPASSTRSPVRRTAPSFRPNRRVSSPK